MTICYLPRIERVPAMFNALANRRRRSVLHLIGTTNMTATEIGTHLGISQQAASRHIAVLQNAGLVARTGWEGYIIDASGFDELTYFINTFFAPRDRYARRLHWS